jgi:hypothetical protein
MCDAFIEYRGRRRLSKLGRFPDFEDLDIVLALAQGSQQTYPE